jgi:mannosyl-3-phosphoglycerate phosphatase
LNSRSRRFVVYADIDGTLLDSRYEAGEVELILRRLLALGANVVFDSSKTEAEIEFYREKWSINDPFIVENGSAIFIPRNYFHQTPDFTRKTEDYGIIELGMSYSKIRKHLANAKAATRSEVRGFGDMSAQEVEIDTGLPLSLAELAKKRGYSEPFKLVSGSEGVVLAALASEGVLVTRGGRYLHAIGDTDKGKAAKILNILYRTEFKEVFCVAVGDSANDLPLLNVVDKPFWVDQKNPKEKVWAQILSSAQTFLEE